ncbi:MAG: sigma-70 family RNA polymerase sigma factor [Cyclobacteriaceae bacterium]
MPAAFRIRNISKASLHGNVTKGHSSISQLVDNLFRKEYGRLVPFLTRFMGVSLMAYAEDIAQETLIEAYKSWGDHGIPENPSAWLFKVARHKSINFINREKKLEEVCANSDLYLKLSTDEGELTLEHEIDDSVLRMFFACCAPQITFENQILLILNTLGGFSRKEIANALLMKEETVKKRLFRIKKEIREGEQFLEVPTGKDLVPRLNAIHNTLYLLFNEGYNSSNKNTLIRKDICLEAMRLCKLVIKHFPEDYSIKSLFALMCFHTARFDSRIDNKGAIIVFEDQDRTKWNKELIDMGIYYLSEASNEKSEVSVYHLEANIASVHCTAKSFEDTDWLQIEKLYHWLYLFKPTPIIKLNLAIVSSKIVGLEKALEQLEYLEQTEGKLKNYYLLHATMGEFYKQLGKTDKAMNHFAKAKHLTNSSKERQLIDAKIVEHT